MVGPKLLGLQKIGPQNQVKGQQKSGVNRTVSEYCSARVSRFGLSTQ